MQDDNILTFAKTILGGDLKNSMPELTKEEFQDAQREALTKTAGEFLKQGYSVFGSLDTPQQVDECARKVSRMDFDLQFYTLLIQLCGKLDVEKDANNFLDMILNVTEHACKLLGAVQPKIDEKEAAEENVEMQEEEKDLSEEEKKQKEEEKQ